ncbi:MAG: hypothetical protein SH808_05890 [Saprospiraceae bacterium]|nr:hypothetical protein [Saprospiraceae bacterium]
MAIKQAGKSLASRHSPLADTLHQLEVLNQHDAHVSNHSSFSSSLERAGYPRLSPGALEILQINIGKQCNQSCAHCLVDAGPDRTEAMSKDLLSKCLDIIRRLSISTIDITRGAPELNTHFRWFVMECRKLNCHIINRCNLTIIVSNPKYNDLLQFFADQEVHLICSLPHLQTPHRSSAG